MIVMFFLCDLIYFDNVDVQGLNLEFVHVFVASGMVIRFVSIYKLRREERGYRVPVLHERRRLWPIQP